MLLRVPGQAPVGEITSRLLNSVNSNGTITRNKNAHNRSALKCSSVI